MIGSGPASPRGANARRTRSAGGLRVAVFEGKHAAGLVSRIVNGPLSPPRR